MLRKGFLSFFTIERRRKFITGFILAMAVYSILLKFLNLILGIGRYHSCDFFNLLYFYLFFQYIFLEAMNNVFEYTSF